MGNKPEEHFQAALSAAYFYLKFRPRSKKEVERHLLKKAKKYTWSSAVVQKALVSLEQNNFINDQDFVTWFVSSRNTGKPKSEFLIRGELLQVGIDKQLLDNYFMDNKQNEEENAYRAAKSKWGRMHDMNEKDRFKKSASFLKRRGFSWDVIKKVIDKLEQNR